MDEKVICFQLCGDRDNPSVSVSDTAYCIPANPMSDRGQAVCMAIEDNGARPSHKWSGLNEHIPVVCFRKTAHPMNSDGFQGWEETKVADTLNVYDTSESRTPIVIVYEKQQEILVFKERAGCAGGGKGILITKNKSFTLSTLLDESICYLSIGDTNENAENHFEGV